MTGIVEDTIKAQGQRHKKNLSQRQPYRGQTLSRPRTGMLEAKEQGHKPKCSPKKKVFGKSFQAISKTEGLQKKFSDDLQKKPSSKKFFRRLTNF